MPETEQWTVGRLLSWTTDYLTRSGAGAARLDAEVLLAEARHCQRIDLYTAYEEVASDEVRTAFRELVRRRAEGVPVAYLVGNREFYSLPFFVNPDVLIPRPETEFVVIAALDWAKQSAVADRQIDVLDVGTGSGVIAVCIARHLPASQVTAVDVCPAALNVARRNVKKHELDERVTLLQSDLLDSVPSDRMFDIIVSNPPYVSRQEYDQLDDGVRLNEPKKALLAGETGTEVILGLIDQAGSRLRPGGILAVEVSPMIAQATRSILEQDARYEKIQVINDLAGLARVVQAQRAG